MNSLPDKLKELRIEKNLLQKDVAKLLNITPSAYGYYEQGKRDPDSTMLYKISDVFNVSIDYLLGLTNIRNSNMMYQYLDYIEANVIETFSLAPELAGIPPIKEILSQLTKTEKIQLFNKFISDVTIDSDGNLVVNYFLDEGPSNYKIPLMLSINEIKFLSKFKQLSQDNQNKTLGFISALLSDSSI